MPLSPLVTMVLNRIRVLCGASVRCDMICHYGFYLQLSDNEWRWAFFHVCWPCVCMSSLQKCLFSPFAQCLSRFFVILVNSPIVYLPVQGRSSVLGHWGHWVVRTFRAPNLVDTMSGASCAPSRSSQPFWQHLPPLWGEPWSELCALPFYRGQWRSGMLLWTSPRRSGSTWSLRRRTCTGTWWWRSTGTWSLWVRWQLRHIIHLVPVTPGWHRNRKVGQIGHVGCSSYRKLNRKLIGNEVGKSIYHMYYS